MTKRALGLVAMLTLAVMSSSCEKVTTRTSMQTEPEKVLSKQAVRQLVVKHFPSFNEDQIQKMFCIAYAESSFDTWRMGDKGERGIFQIKLIYTSKGEVCEQWKPDELWNENNNTACAALVYKARGFDDFESFYISQRDANDRRAQKYLSCRRGEIGFGK